MAQQSFVNSLKFSAPVMTLNSRDTQKEGVHSRPVGDREIEYHRYCRNICLNLCDESSTQESFRMQQLLFVA